MVQRLLAARKAGEGMPASGLGHPRHHLLSCSVTVGEQAVTSWGWPCSRAGTCLPHVPMVLAPCHGFQGHLTSTTEARSVLVSWVLPARLCLFLVLVPAQISAGAKTNTSTNAPPLLIAWGAQASGLSPISSAARSTSAFEQEQGTQRYIQKQRDACQ